MTRLLTPRQVADARFDYRINPLTGSEWYAAEQVDEILEACEHTIQVLATLHTQQHNNTTHGRNPDARPRRKRQQPRRHRPAR